MSSLVHLEVIAVNSNRLTELPSFFSGYSKLRVLQANPNRIQSFDDGIADIASLSVIRLANICISSWSESPV